MLNITHIYNIQGDIKLLDSLNYTQIIKLV